MKAMSSAIRPVYVQGRGLTKSFGHVRALQDVDIDIYEDEILAIVGDNGAGKSTLTKILSGVHQPDRGEVRINGEPVRIMNPPQPRQLSLTSVFHTLALLTPH